jgi:hypothetical protein
MNNDKTIYCICEDWPIQSKIIDSFIVLQAVRSGQYDLYTKKGGKEFIFCPFCGYKLKKNK